MFKYALQNHGFFREISQKIPKNSKIDFTASFCIWLKKPFVDCFKIVCIKIPVFGGTPLLPFSRFF